VAWIMVIYSGLTFLCMLTYWAGGMSLFDAINHAMTTLSTGGYSTYDASFGAFQSNFLEWVCVAFMMAGSIPFLVYVAAFRGGIRQFWAFSQVRTFVLLLAVVSVCLAVWLTVNRAIPFLDALRLAAFNVTSVVTTTGYATTDYSLWGPTALALFLCLTFVGGCSGSTAGGIKIFRLQILFMEVRRYLLRMASPHRVIELTYDGKPVAPEVPNAVLAFIAVFMATMGFFTAGLAAFGRDLVTAITGAATALCNVGPGLGEVIGPAGNFASLPDGAKWLLSFAMLAGRLELFTLLVLLSPGFWIR
jgi:trk system potassium uptake protein